MVALANSEVHIYRDKYLVDKIKCEDVVTGMKFGRFGREDASLVMTTKGEGNQNRNSILSSTTCLS